ncbi:hypothetical protein V493_02403 [Pseudogymnoascus sp. VKM F-4281 (FW-2241)]|nr:hypothetical protein V493_02403 [Pseudogymnoascus sp. VKM F-4281 (FW-2241)]
MNLDGDTCDVPGLNEQLPASNELSRRQLVDTKEARWLFKFKSIALPDHDDCIPPSNSLVLAANMISDDELYALAIFLGSAAMLMIVLYHFLEANSVDVDAKTGVTVTEPTSGSKAKSIVQ